MEGKKLLKEFYLIADELDKNILRFNELEKMLDMAKENNDTNKILMLLNEYEKVAENIKKLNERSRRLKEEM